MSAPTPMPWHADGLAIESARHGNIGIVNLARASKADARLIAAAPDLLKALQTAVRLADANCQIWDGAPRRTPECQAVYDQCVAAIAKATGAA